MLLSIILIILSFSWLFYETKCFSVRLPYGRLIIEVKKINLNPIDNPYYWKSDEQREQSFILCRNDYHCPYRARCKKSERWLGWKIPARTVKAFNSTLNFEAMCNIKRALLLKDMAKELKHKPSQTVKAPCQSVVIPLIEDRLKLNQYGHRTSESETVYHDSLVSKEWLEAHLKDEYPEPLIEIIVNNGKSISVNGNYKPKMITEFMSEYTEVVRAGKRNMRINKGDIVRKWGKNYYADTPINQEV
jgi:hypothetical protein